MNKLIVNNNKYSVDCGEYDKLPILAEAVEKFASISKQFNEMKSEYEEAKEMVEQMCKEAHDTAGFKSLKGTEHSLTFVPGTEGRVEYTNVLDELKVEVLVLAYQDLLESFKELQYEYNETMKDVGLDLCNLKVFKEYVKEELYRTEEKKVGARKDSIRFR